MEFIINGIGMFFVFVIPVFFGLEIGRVLVIFVKIIDIFPFIN